MNDIETSRYSMRDPTAELSPVMRERIMPPASLQGSTVGLLSIAKERSAEFLDSVESQLADQIPGIHIRRFEKPTHTKPAPESVLAQVVESCDAVVIALADWGSCTSCSLHDIQTLDKRGIPGCVVMSKEFEPAAEAQSKALGFAPAIVQVPHPIQNRTPDELKIIAADSFDVILNLITSDKTAK